jgi:hypothetical protein
VWSTSCKCCPIYPLAAMKGVAQSLVTLLIILHSRGKKIFRRFSDPEQDRSSSACTDISEAPGQRTLKRQAGESAQRPLTRSSIKPRLLFPTEDQIREREEAAADDVDEDAVTDIEMPNASSPPKDKGKAHEMQTPTKTRFKPVTPPTTARVTRTKKAAVAQPTPIPEEEEDEPEPISLGTDDTFPAKKTSKSPFDSWQRTKAGRKRPGEASESMGAGKRTRSSAVESPA